jgi:hypothetical protein
VEGELAGIWAELLVEELLQLQRPSPLLGVGRVESRLRMAFLESGDDRGRVGDRAAGPGR